MGWWAVVQGILTAISVAQGIKSYRQAKKLEREANQLLIQKYGTGGGIPVVYGTRRIAGTVVFADTVNNRELFVVYALCVGEVTDITNIQIGGRSIFDKSVFDHALVRKSNYYGQTQQEINNILANQNPPNKPRMVFNCHMGEDDQVADPMLVGCVPGWTSAHQLKGITYLACNFDYDSGGGMFNGLPEITCTVQGKKLYDPTKDSTITNGSGSHRQDDTSTHEYSDNTSLVLLDYLTNSQYGKGIPYSAIDIQSFITSTNRHTTSTNVNHSATVQSIVQQQDLVTLARTSANLSVFNKIKVGNTITITGGGTTYASGIVMDKATNTRHTDGERTYKSNTPGYDIPYDVMYEIYLNNGAVQTAVDFSETPVSITINENGKRFPFNGVIDTDKTIFENVKDINANMRGIFTYTNGQYSLKIEDSESVTLSIDDDDILSSGITVNLENKADIYNIVEVEFANAQKDYELDTASYKHVSATSGQDYTYDDNGEELKLAIDMPFITSQAIAYQYARAILKRSRNNKEIAFQGTPKLLNAKVGEIISVTNSELGMNAEQYRITEMTINSDLTVQVNAIIYQSDIYGFVTPPGETIEIPDDPVDSFRVDTPTNLNFVDKDPSTGVQPYLTWNNSSNYPAYEFRVVIKDSSSNVLYDGRTKNTHFDLSGIQVANGYTAEVQAINTNRVESEVATYNFNNSVPPVQNNDLGDSSVTDSKVADISADKIDTGVLNLGTESGMAVRQGKTGYTSTTTGFWLGNDSGTPKFHIGTSSNFLKFDGSALNIAGSLTATNLTIDANATINGTLDASVIRLDGQDLSNLLAFGTVTGQTGNFFKINNQLDLEGRFYWDANNQTNYWDLGNGSEDQVSLYVKAEAPIVFQDGGSALGTFELNFGDDVNNVNNNATDYISLIADWSNAKQSSGDVTKFIIKGRSDDLNSAPQQTIASFEFSSADGFGLAKTVFNGQIETPRAVIEDYITIEQDTAPSSTTDKLYNVGGSLYWNGAVVDTGGGDITSVNISTSSGSLTGGANFSSGDATFTLDIASTIRGAKTFDDDVVIEGDLTVQGATTSLEVATLNVEDKNITLNYGTGDTSGSANGSGITIQDAVSQGNDATILWNTTNDEFDFSHGIDVSGTVTNEGLILNANTSLYSTDATLSNYSSTNGVYLNGNIGGWLRLNGDRTQHQRLDLFGNNGGGYIRALTQNKNRLDIANNGDISFYEDTGTSQSLFWDASAERLGISNTSPTAPLSIGGTGSLGAISNNYKIATSIDGGFSTTNARQHKVIGFIGTTAGITDIYDSSYASGERSKNFYSGIFTDNSYFNSSSYRIVQGGKSRLTIKQDGEFVINDDSIDRDFRVESDNNTHALFVEGSNGNVGIKNSNPTATLTVGTLTSGQTGNLVINNEGGNTATLEVLSRTNRSALKIADNDTIGYMSAEGGILSIGRTYGLSANNINIDSSHKVGIKNSNPSSQYFNTLVVGNTGGENGITIQSGATNRGVLAFSDTDSATAGRYDGYIAYDHNSTQMSFHTNTGNKHLTINANGYILVNKTATGISTAGALLSDVGSHITRNGGSPLSLNRLTSNGVILDIRKDSLTVGNIGTYNSDLHIGTGNTGIGFNNNGRAIVPMDTSTPDFAGSLISLGTSSVRFKDLHLSGTAYIGTNLEVQGTLSAGTIAPDSVNTDTLNTESIIFDSGSTNIATQNVRSTTTSSTSQTAIVNMASSFTSVKFQVQITDATTSSFHVTEIMVLNDGTNQYISEYGTITTGSALATFDADKTATNLRLLATPTTSNTLAYKIIYQAIYS